LTAKRAAFGGGGVPRASRRQQEEEEEFRVWGKEPALVETAPNPLVCQRKLALKYARIDI
jgi:hypothetical protein